MVTAPIFVIDELVAHPGKAEEVSASYIAHYAPAAQRRGMILCHRWISPPVRLGDTQSNTLTFVWSVAGVAGWWKMRHGALAEPSTASFWASLEPLIEQRRRSFHAEVTDV